MPGRLVEPSVETMHLSLMAPRSFFRSASAD
jgi:hypothetical protein